MSRLSSWLAALVVLSIVIGACSGITIESQKKSPSPTAHPPSRGGLVASPTTLSDMATPTLEAPTRRPEATEAIATPQRPTTTARTEPSPTRASISTPTTSPTDTPTQAPTQGPTPTRTPTRQPTNTPTPAATAQTDKVTLQQIYQQLMTKFNAARNPKSADPKQLYAKQLAKYGRDYTPCGVKKIEPNDQCKKPESLKGDLKPNVNIELILDASGSMQGRVGGERKIDIAKRVLTEFIDTLPDKANVALRVYGHVGSNSERDKTRSCAGSQLIYPFQRIDRAKFKEAVKRFDAKGWTPIASSLEKSKSDFARFDPNSSSNFVYLVSDGIETCGGDPVKAARELQTSDIDVQVNIVGFDVNQDAARQLQAVARSGGGTYYEAGNSDELEKVFKDNYDWSAWTAYYNCKYNTYWSYYTAQYNAQWRGYTCVYNTAWGEYTDIYNAAWRTYTDHYNYEWRLYNKIYNEVWDSDKYAKYRDDILRKAIGRRDGAIEAAQKQRDYTIAHAKDRRDRLIKAAKDKRVAVIEQAQQERDEAIDQAKKHK